METSNTPHENNFIPENDTIQNDFNLDTFLDSFIPLKSMSEFDSLDSYIDYLHENQKIQSNEEEKPEKKVRGRKRKQKNVNDVFKFVRKKNSRNKQLEIEEVFCEEIKDINYFPPGWIDVEMSFKEVVDYYFSTLRGKKSLDPKEKLILKNLRLLRDCYCTSKTELLLANIFIGKFEFDPFYNPYSFTLTEKFSKIGAQFLDGSCPELDGFNIKNWPETVNSFFVNPPFSKLPEAFFIANEVSKRATKPSIAVVANFDYTNYIKNAFNFADYCILLGRVQYKPMIGMTVTDPRWSSTMTIYNSKFNLPNGSTRLFLKGREYYAIDLKNKKSMDLLQLELFP